MGLFSGLGRGLGAAAVGYGAGENRGEALAWQRMQQEKANQLRLLAAQKAVRPPDDPLPLKSLYQERTRVYSSNDPTALRNWIESGMEDVFQQVNTSFAQGGASAALGVYGTAARPVGSPVEQMAGAGNPYAGRQFLSPPPAAAAGPKATGRPALNPEFAPRYSPKTDAQTKNIGAQTNEINTLLPHKEAKLVDDLLNAQFTRGRLMRNDEWDRAADTFKMWLDRFKAQVDQQQGDTALLARTFSDMMTYAGKLQQAGGQVGRDLMPFLKSRGAGGAEFLNVPVARQLLAQRGYNDQQIRTILGGWQGVQVDRGGAVGAPGGSQQAGGPPTLPPVGGAAPPIPGSFMGANVNLEGMPSNAREALNWAVQDLSQAGITPRIVSAHRDRAKQAQLYADYKAGRGNLAAPPGTSQHEHGRAVDIHVPKNQQARLEQVMGARGYVRTVKSEPWHFEYQGSDSPSAAPAGGQAAPSGSPSLSGVGLPGGGTGAPGMNPFGATPEVQNPYHPENESFEWNVVTALTNGRPGQQIVDDLRNMGRPDDSARAAAIITNFMSRRQSAGGPPQPNTSSTLPSPPSPGTLDYTAADYARFAGGAAPPGTPVVPTRQIVSGVIGQQPEVVPATAPPAPAAPEMVAGPPAPAAPPPATANFPGGVNFPTKPPVTTTEMGRATITLPPPPRVGVRMGARSPSASLAQAVDPIRAGAAAGKNILAGGIQGIAAPDSVAARIAQTVREKLFPAIGGASSVGSRPKQKAGRNLFDVPALKKEFGWNDLFRPWAQRMNPATPEDVGELYAYYDGIVQQLRGKGLDDKRIKNLMPSLLLQVGKVSEFEIGVPTKKTKGMNPILSPQATPGATYNLK